MYIISITIIIHLESSPILLTGETQILGDEYEA